MLRKQVLPVVKVLVACAAVVALVSLPARQLAPRLSLLELVLLLLCAFVVLVAVTVASLALAQFVLRKGGTDPQWFWFSGEPPGLENLREQQREKQRES